jgi:imidazolonepropionase-like amidohydrolase
MATLIKNGKIYTMAGPVIEGGSILIENGKITAVGQDVVAPVNAEIIDAAGRMVLPGMIDAHSHLGMVESAIGSVMKQQLLTRLRCGVSMVLTLWTSPSKKRAMLV